jgi:hypothetical protein
MRESWGAGVHRVSTGSVGRVSRTSSGVAKLAVSSAPSRAASLAGTLPYAQVLIDGFEVPKVTPAGLA